uniref:E3 ubiquitin-protein ligase RNF170 n=1 Tax=Saccoglossus kowalevskii TaxID=10224 RepID=A0ABM0MWD2_SACKO|nr:PREDICTED: E3 ubiquitin-protein ligase RNF170-like isoform X2 [Saccoglossus kowalevskii]
MFMRNRYQHRSQAIHPDHQQRVNNARLQLGINEDNGDANHQGATRNGLPGQQRRYAVDLQCPVCLQDAQYPTETNCGHVFCANCIITYWRHGSWLGAVHCPVCRQQVTILLADFSPEERQSEEGRAKMRDLHDYNRRFSGEPRPFMDYIRDLPTLLRHAWGEFFSLGGLVWMFRLRILLCFLAALLYFISPLDIIPEAVFGVLGFMDDLFVLLLLLIYVSIIYRNIVTNRAQNA